MASNRIIIISFKVEKITAIHFQNNKKKSQEHSQKTKLEWFIVNSLPTRTSRFNCLWWQDKDLLLWEVHDKKRKVMTLVKVVPLVNIYTSVYGRQKLKMIMREEGRYIEERIALTNLKQGYVIFAATILN